MAVDNTVMVTWANLHYLDFVINWVEHVRGLGITSYLVGAMDDDILKALVTKGVNTFAMGSGLSLGDFGWGSATFHKMVRSLSLEFILTNVLFLCVCVCVCVCNVVMTSMIVGSELSLGDFLVWQPNHRQQGAAIYSVFTVLMSLFC